MKVKLFCAAAAVTTFAFVLSTPLAAQWVNLKTPGIPRTPDGKPDLSAPVPRTADGKPDLSGIWRAPRNSPYARNIAVDLKPEEILPWAQALYQQHVLDLGADSPRAHCLPDPPPYYHLAGMSRVVQTPTLTVIINEGVSNSDVTRTIFTDGRVLPEEMNPTWLGYSVGHWEADTLVVTTAGFNDRTWLDFFGHPHSEALRITERFHRRDFGHMDFEMTLEDPKAFTKPITFKADKTLEVDTELLETICEYSQHTQHLVGGKRFRLPPETLAKYAGTYEFAQGREAWSPSMANCWSCISARVERSYLSRPNQKHPSWQHCSGSRLNSSKTPAALSPGLFCAPEPVRASAIDNSPSKKPFAKKGGSREPSSARFDVALEAVRRSG